LFDCVVTLRADCSGGAMLKVGDIGPSHRESGELIVGIWREPLRAAPRRDRGRNVHGAAADVQPLAQIDREAG
jgi:hypothetical protein